MNKSLIFSGLLILSLTVGCASKGTKSRSQGNNDGGDPASEVMGGDEGSSDGNSNSQTPPNKKPEGGYKALSQAVRSGNAKAVTDETSRILVANPNDAVALNALALMYIRRAKPGAAKLVLNRALEKNAGIAALYNNLGVILLEEGDVPAATVQFKKALKADAGHIEANGNLGAIYASGADYERARPLLETAYKANRANLAYANNYAISLRALKDYEGAKRIYEENLKKDARDLPTLLNYAILLIDYMNKPKEGLDVVYKVQFMDSDRKDVQAKVIALEKKAKSEVK